MTDEKEAKFWADKLKLEAHSTGTGSVKGIDITEKEYDDALASAFDAPISARLLNISKENFYRIKQEQIREKNVPIEKEREKNVQLLGETYENIIKILKKYCDLEESQYPVIALWIIGTYTHKKFNTFPLLFINATKGSGKSRLLRLIMALAWNGKVVIDLREAALFRTAKDCSIGIDEFESVGSKEYGTLRTLLNAAYKKGAFVERMHKVFKDKQETQEVERFPLYTPVAFANIFGMEEVLGDRCIHLILEKSDKKHITKLFEDFEENEEILEIKRTLSVVSVVSVDVVAIKHYRVGWNNYIMDKYTTTSTTPITLSTLTSLSTLDILNEEFYRKINESEIESRNLELFFPLFIIAKLISEEILDNILKIAKFITTAKKEEEYIENRDIQLVDFVSKRSTFDNEFHALTKLTQEFKTSIAYETEEMHWLNSRWLTRALKRMNIIKEKRRTAQGVEVILNIEKAKEKLTFYKEGLK